MSAARAIIQDKPLSCIRPIIQDKLCALCLDNETQSFFFSIFGMTLTDRLYLILFVQLKGKFSVLAEFLWTSRFLADWIIISIHESCPKHLSCLSWHSHDSLMGRSWHKLGSAYCFVARLRSSSNSSSIYFIPFEPAVWHGKKGGVR